MANTETLAMANTVEEEEDRISQLPNDILHQILFFAGMRKAVQVSVLSKRWTHLWASTPLLNFDVSEFFTVTGDHHHENSKLDSFANKFQHFRHCRGTFDGNGTRIITKLRIGRFDDGPVRHFFISGILLTAGLTELQVNLYCPPILRCKHQCKPKIYRVLWPTLYTELGQAAFDCFPLLVQSQEFYNYHYCRFSHSYLRLTETPPISFYAENVLISHSDFSSIDIQCSRGLKVLKLWHCRTLEGDIRVSAPNLVSLDFRQIRASSLSLLDHDYPFLKDAVLDFTISDNGNGGGEDDETRNIFTNILPKLHHAKALTLTTSLLKGLNVQQNLLGHLPTFHNLKNVVVIRETSNTQIEILKDLLQLWPNLEKVEIKHRRRIGELGGGGASTAQLLPPTRDMSRTLLALGLACASTVQLLPPTGVGNIGWTLATLGLGYAYLFFARRNNFSDRSCSC